MRATVLLLMATIVVVTGYPASQADSVESVELTVDVPADRRPFSADSAVDAPTDRFDDSAVDVQADRSADDDSAAVETDAPADRVGSCEWWFGKGKICGHAPADRIASCEWWFGKGKICGY